MKKKVAIVLAVITISTAVPAMAHGYGNRANCSNNGVCQRVCDDCGNALEYGVCTGCGKDNRLYQYQYYRQDLHRGYGCHR